MLDVCAESWIIEHRCLVISGLEKESDVVLIDRPPVLPVTDTLVVAAVTGNVLLEIGPKARTRSAIASARQQVGSVGARIIGAVLNVPDPSLAQANSY
jgi:Mrp family chromosome partitioning ATPase